jgi:antitoxin HicB
MEYQALLTPEDGGFVVTFPDFEWGVTQGDSEADALAMAAEVVEIVMQDCIDKGKPLPTQRLRSGKKFRTVRLPALMAAKGELYAAFREAGITKAELGRRLGIPRTNVDRLFQLSHRSRLDLIEAALRVVGKELAITVAPVRPQRVAA